MQRGNVCDEGIVAWLGLVGAEAPHDLARPRFRAARPVLRDEPQIGGGRIRLIRNPRVARSDELGKGLAEGMTGILRHGVLGAFLNREPLFAARAAWSAVECVALRPG